MSKGIIYKIVNLASGKVYIGQSSQKGNARLRRHFRRLNSNRHPNKRLQEDFNSYPESFESEVLGEYSLDELDRMEKFYIADYRSMEEMFGYNQIYGKRKRRGTMSELEYLQLKEELAAYKRINESKDLQIEQLRMRIDELEARNAPKCNPRLYEYAVQYLQRYYELNKEEGVTYIHSSFIQTMLKNKADMIGEKFGTWIGIRDAMIANGWLKTPKEKSPMIGFGPKLSPALQEFEVAAEEPIN